MCALLFKKDDSGVENAVYGILMIAIVVMVALLIGSLVLSQGGQVQVLASSPKASLTGVLSAAGTTPTLLISHESGDPLQVNQLVLNVYDDEGVLIDTTDLSKGSQTVTPDQLSPGSQTSKIELTGASGKIDVGARYTVKVVSSQSKQMIASMVLVAR